MRRIFILFGKGILCSLFLAACASPSPSAGTGIPPNPSASATQSQMPCTILPYATDVTVTMSAFIDEYAHVIDAPGAQVTLLVFTDFQCPGCALLAESIAQVQAAHLDKVRLIVRYLPDPRYDKSVLAFQAVEAAHLQGKYWEMYNLIFNKQPEWSGLSPEDFPSWLETQAGNLGLDLAQFNADFNGELVAERIQLALQSTADIDYLPPLLFINSTTPYTGMADTTSLEKMVRLALLDLDKLHTCPVWRVDPLRQYLATLHTAKGDVIIQLFPDKAALAVNNFIYLARSGWYDQITFHNVQPGFVIQTGDPSGTGFGNPGYYFSTEASSGLSFDKAGVVAMSNVGADTNGSQFFITFAPAPQLDGQFTIFGEVVNGMDILGSLAVGDELLSITVDER